MNFKWVVLMVSALSCLAEKQEERRRRPSDRILKLLLKFMEQPETMNCGILDEYHNIQIVADYSNWTCQHIPDVKMMDGTCSGNKNMMEKIVLSKQLQNVTDVQNATICSDEDTTDNCEDLVRYSNWNTEVERKKFLKMIIQ